MTVWVLIVVSAVYGYSSSNVQFQEFSSQDRCAVAAQAITQSVKTMELNIKPVTACLQK